MQTILITGNLGYNGCTVTRVLTAAGYRTIGTDIHLFQDRLYDDTPYQPTRQIYKDVRDIEAEDIEAIDAIVHLAALANDPIGERYPELTFRINTEASVRLAELAKAHGVGKFIFASSTAVYGIQDPTAAADENSPVDPRTQYARSKTAAETELLKLDDETFRVIIMRNSTMHGISPKMRLDIVLNNLAAYAHVEHRVNILSDGTPWRPMISVDDFARAVQILVGAEPRHRIYNIGFDSENYRVRELGQLVAEHVQVPLDINENQTPEERSYRVNHSRFADEFPEFTPDNDVRESIRRLAATYRDCSLGAEEFKGPKFFRVRALTEAFETGRLTPELRKKHA